MREAILKELERRIDQLWKQADIPHMDAEDRQRLTGRCNGLIDFHSWILHEAISQPPTEAGEFSQWVTDALKMADYWVSGAKVMDDPIGAYECIHRIADVLKDVGAALEAADAKVAALREALESILADHPGFSHERARAALEAL